MKKKRDGLDCLEDVPNIGSAIAADLRQLGITLPIDLVGRDPYAMYDDLCRLTGQRHDPCLLDTFIAAVRYMEGEPKSLGGNTRRNASENWHHEPRTSNGPVSLSGHWTLPCNMSD